VVWHKTVCPNFDACFAHLYSQQISIHILVTVFEKDGFSAVPPLRRVMWKMRNHNASQPSHAGYVNTKSSERIGIMSPYSHIPKIFMSGSPENSARLPIVLRKTNRG
jgi:hypothetical protein